MASLNDIDIERAHRYFSASCFNSAWGLIDEQERTPEEDQQMVLLAFASLWHWTQRPDCLAKHLSIGYWQISRIFSILKDAENAKAYAQLCLAKTPRNEPFYLGYAYEALARAESLTGNRSIVDQYLADAQRQADAIDDQESRKLLADDLASLTR